jgi:heptosyltransferase-2
MNVLILKLGASGDVVRTTPLLARLDGQVTWVTAQKNMVLLEGVAEKLSSFSWEQRDRVPDITYDLVINLEDTIEVGAFLRTRRFGQLFGAYADAADRMCYTEDSRGWFDLSWISRHGRAAADRLKFLNRHAYQELIFAGLGFRFSNEPYLLPGTADPELSGDIAIAATAGPVWPMKNWAYYEELKQELESRGYTVNFLPVRKSLLEHLADVRGHRCLVSGDSLPMHFGMGACIRCVSLFNCTSPWEIHGYGLQHKIVSPLLEQFFYRRDYDRRAVTSILLDEVLQAVLRQLELRDEPSGPVIA